MPITPVVYERPRSAPTAMSRAEGRARRGKVASASLAAAHSVGEARRALEGDGLEAPEVAPEIGHLAPDLLEHGAVELQRALRRLHLRRDLMNRP